MYVCTVCMAGYPSVSCNRIIENKRNKTKKKGRVSRMSQVFFLCETRKGLYVVASHDNGDSSALSFVEPEPFIQGKVNFTSIYN